MSQYGMQMPGGNLQRGPSLNVYTGLLAAAVIALLAASVFVFIEGGKVAPNGNAFAIHQFDANQKKFDLKLP
jgi:hypothetical protein